MNPRVQFEDEADVGYRLPVDGTKAGESTSGFEFFDAVDETIDRILDLPQAGSPVPRMPADLPVRTMAVTRFPYHVIYLEVKDRIRILAIAHDRRKPGYWLSRIRK